MHRFGPLALSIALVGCGAAGGSDGSSTAAASAPVTTRRAQSSGPSPFRFLARSPARGDLTLSPSATTQPGASGASGLPASAPAPAPSGAASTRIGAGNATQPPASASTRIGAGNATQPPASASTRIGASNATQPPASASTPAPTSGSSGSASASTGAPSAPAARTAGPPPAPRAMTDEDGDGLQERLEERLGTSPLRRDSDGDGVIDGSDLAPRFGASDYGELETEYPVGAVRSTLEHRACGLDGETTIERGIGIGNNWKTTYEGDRATRESDLGSRAVQESLEERYAESDYEPVDLRPMGRARRFGGERFRKTVLFKRYTLDYDFRGRDYEVELQNSAPVELEDERGRPFAVRTAEVEVEGDRDSTLILQFSLDPAADRFRTGEDYVVPAMTFQVFDDDDPDGAGLVQDDVAIASRLHDHAYEVRLPLVKPTGRGPRTWTVAMNPVWLRARDGQQPAIEAIAADDLRVAAVAHDLRLVAGERFSRRALGIVSSFRGLSRDLRARAARAAWEEVVSRTYQVVQKEESQTGRAEWVVTRVEETNKIVSTSRDVLTLVEEASVWTRGEELKDVLSDENYRRYERASDALKKARFGSLLVIHGSRAVVAHREGDQVRAAVYTGKAGAAGVKLAKEFSLVPKSAADKASAGVGTLASGVQAANAYRNEDYLGAAIASAQAGEGAVDLANAYGRASDATAGKVGAGVGAFSNGLRAWQAHDRGNDAAAVVHTARGAASLGKFYFKEQALSLGNRTVQAVSAIKVALGVVEVGYSLHKAQEAEDAIVQQYYLEQAAASAVDLAITFVPTVGPAIQLVWGTAWAVANLIEPDLAKHSRILRSPGTFVVFVGTVFLTQEVPSAFAEQAYEEAAKALQERVERLERGGQPCVIVLPAVG